MRRSPLCHGCPGPRSCPRAEARLTMKKSATKITGATMGLAAFLGLGTTASAAQSQPGCALVPVATVDSVYGVKVGAPTAVSKPPVTVCTYDSLQPIVSVLVRF